jgi:hypothetical protein
MLRIAPQDEGVGLGAGDCTFGVTSRLLHPLQTRQSRGRQSEGPSQLAATF